MTDKANFYINFRYKLKIRKQSYSIEKFILYNEIGGFIKFISFRNVSL